MSIANTWRWLPDWSPGITERLEWRTDVQQGYTGHEERYALRQIPRRTWSWEMVLEGHERQRFEAEFFAKATQSWLVPLWWDVQRSALTSLSTSYTRAIAPEDRELPNGGYLVIADRVGAIGKGPVIRTTGTIGGVPSETFSWTGALGRNFPTGRVYAARMAQVALTDIEHVTAGVARYKLTAESVEDFAVAPTGVEQWPLRPDRAEPLGSQWDILRERVDFGGAWQYDTRRTKPLRGAELSYKYGTRIETYLVRTALTWLAGQYREANLPTFMSDLTPTQVIFGTQLDVQPIGWTTAMPTRVAIVRRSGGTIQRNIVGTSMVGSVERLVMSPTLGSTIIPLEDVRQVCWARKSRLASDAIEIIWRTPEVSEFSLPWREVPV
jgi:hypothetical protein